MSLARCVVLLVLVLILIPGIVAAESPASPADLGRELARVLSANPPGLALVQADKTPTASVDGHKGYRIVLRREYVVEPWALQQRVQIREPVQTTELPIIMRSHIDLVLIPDAERVTPGLRNRIKWQDLAQEYYVKPVYMGKGQGFHWFGKTTIFWQDEVRRNMKLAGGDNRIDLALEGLGAEKDFMTRDSMHRIFRAFGDSSVPALLAAIGKHEKDPLSYMDMLGEIETDRSTAALRSFYWSKATDMSWAAGVVLAHGNTRMAAKPEYLDLLHRKDEVDSIARKCVEHGWTEAIPDLEAVMASPEYWTDFQSAFRAHRALTGRPVDYTVHESWRGYEWSGRAGEDARSALDRVEDKEAAAVLLIGAYGMYGKITRDQREAHDRAVLEALGRLPIEIVRPLVETAARCTSAYEKNRFGKLLGEL